MRQTMKPANAAARLAAVNRMTKRLARLMISR
jgi:hypothetical protein